MGRLNRCTGASCGWPAPAHGRGGAVLLMFAATVAGPMMRVPFSQGESMGTRNFFAYYSMPGE
jgi:hypothetical protein